jgi:hypothetical protein
MIQLLFTLAARANATAANKIANISTIRFENISAAWGGWTDNQTGSPDWGRILWEVVSVYPDSVGMIAWVVLFSIPFLMMYLAHADMVPAAVVGIFFGLYAFAFLEPSWQFGSLAVIGIALTAILLQVWQKRP